MIDWRRMLQEKRSLVLPLVAAAVVNVAVYLLVVYPLTARTASVEARAQTAAISLAHALTEFRAAEATRTGRTRADAQLKRFYTEILPRDYPGARRITYLRLAKLAEESNLDYDRRDFKTKRDRDSTLEQLDGSMTLTGEYRDVRQFLHVLETAPEFVVIRDVSLAQQERDQPLTLTLQLATYYQAEP
jgi:Tfp pilus assembly protein PilO